MMNKGSDDSSNILIKYDNPRLVTTTNPDDGNNKGKRQGNSSTRVTSSKAEDILNSILPPREFTTSEGQLWVQNVTSTPSTRQDVIALQKQLDSKLQNDKVRATGLCPVRTNLYTQCFDEIIRQTIIHCMERGIFLQRIRDEINTTISAYMTLYESSIAFGIRKALLAEDHKMKTDKQMRELMGKNVEKEARLKELTKHCEILTRRAEERRLADESRYEKKLEALRRANNHLKHLLEENLATATASTNEY